MLTAFKLIGLNTLITLEILLPSAFFFSVLAAIGRLYRDSEMSAFYAAGISRARILGAVFKAGAGHRADHRPPVRAGATLGFPAPATTWSPKRPRSLT